MRDNARSPVDIWDMNVFVNQLIECKISFKRNCYLDWNFGIPFWHLAACHEEEQNKCKHVVGIVANQDVDGIF